jgi:TfoX/Sxy family transcriptional regulator of competence genes
MYARVSTIEGSAAQLDEGLQRIKTEIVPAVKELGAQGLISLADRANGKSITITLWDTEEDMRESEERANQLRKQAAEGVGATGEPQVERYEIVLYEVEAGVTVS